MKYFLLFCMLGFNFLLSQKIEWKPDRKLIWENFKSIKNNLGNPDIVAYTHCGWEYSVITSSNLKVPVKVDIQTIFNEDKSWKDDKRINDYILIHEQKHFDIAEIHARKLRKELAEKIKNTADFKKYFNSIYSKISSEYKNYQAEYDRETKHGMNKEKQSEYNVKISEDLEKLNNYQKL